MGKKRKRDRKPRRRHRPSPLRQRPPIDDDVTFDADSLTFAWDDDPEGNLSEERAMAIVLKNHPDLERMWKQGTLPDEMVNEDGNVWSPRAHLEMHVIIERQLANDTPAGIVDVADRLKAEKKLNEHDVKHVLAAAVGEQIWYMLKEGVLFDEHRYLSDIDRIYAEWVQLRK